MITTAKFLNVKNSNGKRTFALEGNVYVVEKTANTWSPWRAARNGEDKTCAIAATLDHLLAEIAQRHLDEPKIKSAIVRVEALVMSKADRTVVTALNETRGLVSSWYDEACEMLDVPRELVYQSARKREDEVHRAVMRKEELAARVEHVFPFFYADAELIEDGAWRVESGVAYSLDAIGGQRVVAFAPGDAQAYDDMLGEYASMHHSRRMLSRPEADELERKVLDSGKFRLEAIADFHSLDGEVYPANTSERRFSHGTLLNVTSLQPWSSTPDADLLDMVTRCKRRVRDEVSDAAYLTRVVLDRLRRADSAP